MNRTRIRHSLAAALVLMGMALPARAVDLSAVIDAVRQAFFSSGLHEEEQIGYAAAATILGATHPVDNPEVQRYVNRVGLWIALQSERPDLPWRFAVLDSEDIDAFAAPGGYVFITRGLLLRMNNEAELAGVLGHEISHVVLKHHLKALQAMARTSLVGQVASYKMAQNGQSSAVFDQASTAARNLYSKGLDKDDEFEADRAGVILAARAGYDPYGLLAVLQTLENVDPNSNRMQLLLATHPSPEARIEALSKITGGLDEYGGNGEG
ncbi:MAG: M48 family metalloprotease, partial [Gammaproteobacteria bacterium]